MRSPSTAACRNGSRRRGWPVSEANWWEFKHPKFQRQSSRLLSEIKRRKEKKRPVPGAGAVRLLIGVLVRPCAFAVARAQSIYTRGQGGGVLICGDCLSHLTVDHLFLRGGARMKGVFFLLWRASLLGRAAAVI